MDTTEFHAIRNSLLDMIRCTTSKMVTGSDNEELSTLLQTLGIELQYIEDIILSAEEHREINAKHLDEQINLINESLSIGEKLLSKIQL
jgi:hypothetical protein